MTKIDIEAMRERIKELCEMYAESSEGALDLEKELLDLFIVMLSKDDNDDCHCFDKCRNPLKDKHCDDSMAGSQYCFEE